MKLVYNRSTDPAFNLALEEYALTQLDEDYIMLWRNAPAVIIGSNQNAAEEMNLDFIEEKNITVIRRQSGGGAVFHDLGNINFTVIHTMGEDDFNNYQKFTAPIVEFLATLGVKSELRGRNDLLIDDMKFSGNAQAVRGGRIMHHGTLLFDADFSSLAGALKPNQAKIESKGIKSVRSRVTNISQHLPEPMTVEEFLQKLYDFYLAGGLEEYALSTEDLTAVEKLVENKYSKWDWNFGKSPAYAYQNTKAFPFGIVELHLTAEEGIIEELEIFGDFFGIQDKKELEQALVGTRHSKEDIEAVLRQFDLSQYISGITVEEMLSLF